MADPSASPEMVPLRELNPENPRRESGESRNSGAETGEEVPEHLPFLERAVNFPVLCANIRAVVQGTLDVIPMPASVRNYLKIRWMGIFIATVLFLLLALIAMGIMIFVESSPEPPAVPDPFAEWSKDVS